jgi:hypothetical protein
VLVGGSFRSLPVAPEEHVLRQILDLVPRRLPSLTSVAGAGHLDQTGLGSLNRTEEKSQFATP